MIVSIPDPSPIKKGRAMSRSIRIAILIAALGVLALLAACSSGPGSVEDEDTDRTPPEVVTDLMVTDATSTSAMLQWTAPADHRDDGSGGMVDGYDLRMADESITAESFASAAPVPGIPEPLPAGQRHHFLVTGLAPGATHYFVLKACDDRENWSGLSYCPHADCPAVVVVNFPDPGLEEAIRSHVSKQSGDLYSSDVDTIRYFSAVEAGISDLSGMEALTSLASAQLGNNSIVDLAPLGHLENLVGLYLNANRVSNLSPLVHLVELCQLHLIGNPITNLGPVASLRSLQQLTLSEMEIADFSPLFGLEYLSDLYLGGMSLTDITFVAQLTRLRNLNLEINQIGSVEPLGGLPGLETLNLMQNQIVDIDPLAGLVSLRELHLGKNAILDLQALVNNAGLGAGDVLRVNENPLTPQAIDVQIPALEARGVQVIR
jgi:Leucine-rich repeat (LRR) protein